MCGESRNIELGKLIPFKDDQNYTHEEDWVQLLADCIHNTKRASFERT